MRLRNIPGSRELISDHQLCFLEEDPQAGNWQQIFGNENPIYIEIGMGKGQFLIDSAIANPDINYIGIEKYSSVLVRALEKLETLALKNVRFIRMDAEKICTMFSKDEVDCIYLNFSDPWPKDRHSKRRLTSAEFLKRYNRILTKAGRIEFKTDNKELFQFSLEQAPSAGWHIDAFTWDLHHEPELSKGNIMTEYEQRFSAQGSSICKLVLSR